MMLTSIAPVAWGSRRLFDSGKPQRCVKAAPIVAWRQAPQKATYWSRLLSKAAHERTRGRPALNQLRATDSEGTPTELLAGLAAQPSELTDADRNYRQLPLSVQSKVLQVCRTFLSVHNDVAGVPLHHSTSLLRQLLHPDGVVLLADGVLSKESARYGAAELAAMWRQHQQADPLNWATILSAGCCLAPFCTGPVPLPPDDPSITSSMASASGVGGGNTQLQLHAFLLVRALSANTLVAGSVVPADAKRGDEVLQLYRISLHPQTLQVMAVLCCRQLTPLERTTRLKNPSPSACIPAQSIQLPLIAPEKISSAKIARREAEMLKAVETWAGLWGGGGAADLSVLKDMCSSRLNELDGYGLNARPRATNFSGRDGAATALSGMRQRFDTQLGLTAVALSGYDRVAFYQWVAEATDKDTGAVYPMQGLVMMVFVPAPAPGESSYSDTGAANGSRSNGNGTLAAMLHGSSSTAGVNGSVVSTGSGGSNLSSSTNSMTALPPRLVRIHTLLAFSMRYYPNLLV